MIAKSKAYKKVLKQNRNSHYDKLKNKLRSLKTSNTKEFWKTLKSNKTKTDIKVDFHDLLEHFTSLNQNENSTATTPDGSVDNNSMINHESVRKKFRMVFANLRITMHVVMTALSMSSLRMPLT